MVKYIDPVVCLCLHCNVRNTVVLETHLVAESSPEPSFHFFSTFLFTLTVDISLLLTLREHMKSIVSFSKLPRSHSSEQRDGSMTLINRLNNKGCDAKWDHFVFYLPSL